jgi:hypothetical protein
VKKRAIAPAFAVTFIILLVVGAVADVIPTWEWVNFRGNATFNGQPVPVGSIIDAYDPTGVHCGTFTVNASGIYGYIAVYRDDPYAPNDTTDEGADPGDTISFKVNGRPAQTSAAAIWTVNGDTATIDLTATGTVAVTGVDFPADQVGAPDDTVRFMVGIRNDGDGLDFYGVTSTSTNGWQTINPDTFIYANANETVYVYFDVIIPTFPGNDTVDAITFSIFSYLDTSRHVDSSVNLVVSLSDVEDEPWAVLPSGFQLHQNFPNPFNPKTTISFTLMSRSHVTLEVYNVLGQQIYTNNLGVLPAGDYDVEYDAADSPSGIYFYRLVTDIGSRVRKMIVLK